MRKLFFSTMIAMMLTTLAIANDVKGKVIAVIDGNTLQVQGSDNQTYNILLAGIDSPELGQDFGPEAKKFLEKMILGKNVTVSFKGKDRLGNSLAEVRINGKKDPRLELLKEGLAWTEEKNPLPDLETQRSWAQSKNKGLWKRDNPTPPWIYRREQTMLQRKSS
jgi:micrococcal nuclease